MLFSSSSFFPPETLGQRLVGLYTSFTVQMDRCRDHTVLLTILHQTAMQCDAALCSLTNFLEDLQNT